MGLRPLATSQRSLIDALISQGFKPPQNYPNDAREARIWLYKMLKIVDVGDEELWLIEQANHVPPSLQNQPKNQPIPHIQHRPGYMLLRQFSNMRQRQRNMLNRILGRSPSYHSR
jgi:hypothetical protein